VPVARAGRASVLWQVGWCYTRLRAGSVSFEGLALFPGAGDDRIIAADALHANVASPPSRLSRGPRTLSTVDSSVRGRIGSMSFN
jgi:hypothetical protein